MPGPLMTLEGLGWKPALDDALRALGHQGLEPGRIGVEDKHYYVVITSQGELTGQVTGKLLHQTTSNSELPKVGDWVAFSKVPNEAKAVIHHILPRVTKLSRKVSGREMEEQVLAANIDLAFIVQGLDRTFNPALLQRHLIMIFESGARPLVILNKADLCSDVTAVVAEAESAAREAPVIALSAKTGQGIDRLRAFIKPAETVVFIGPSGVGKSTIINDLYGEEVQATADVRESDAKGRHTTTWRELIVLPNGALVIDTPGMREFQMWLADDGVREAFADLDALAVGCRFRDCAHTSEQGCAVLAARAAGELSEERYQSFLKLKKELSYLEHARTKHSWLQRKRQARVAQRSFNKFKRQSED